MRGRLENESGQAVVLFVVVFVALLGAAAMAVDVGSWYSEQRKAQATADAAALAAAQALPNDTAQAATLAQTYANDNGGGLSPSGVTFSSSFVPDDTVNVSVTRTAPGFFSSLFSIASVTVHAQASARAAIPDQAFGVAPIVVNQLNPQLSGPGCPCFGVQTVLPLGKTGAPGAFALVNLDTSSGGSIGASTIASWIQNGFNQYLDLGDYFSVTGAKWNDGPIQQALTSRIGSELLFPVYDTLTGNGSNATYHIIGWVGFVVQSEDASGSSGSLTGYFTQVIWAGIQDAVNPATPNFGVYSIALVK